LRSLLCARVCISTTVSGFTRMFAGVCAAPRALSCSAHSIMSAAAPCTTVGVVAVRTRRSLSGMNDRFFVSACLASSRVVNCRSTSLCVLGARRRTSSGLLCMCAPSAVLWLRTRTIVLSSARQKERFRALIVYCRSTPLCVLGARIALGVRRVGCVVLVCVRPGSHSLARHAHVDDNSIVCVAVGLHLYSHTTQHVCCALPDAQQTN